MSQRPAPKAVMEANSLWPPKGKGCSKAKALAAAAAVGQHAAPLSKRFAGLQHYLPDISKAALAQPAAAGTTKGSAAAAEGKHAGVPRKGALAPKALPLKRGSAKPAKGSSKQQPLLLPVAARAQQAAAAERAKVKPAAAGSTEAAGQRSPSALRVSRRAAAAGVFAAVVAAGGGTKTPPSHHAAGQTAAAVDCQGADTTATLAAVAASLQLPKQMKSITQAAAASVPARPQAGTAPMAAAKLRNKASAAAAAAARARAKAAPASRAPAAAEAAPRLTGGAGSEHHARATKNPTGTTGIREHKGVFEVFLGTPPFRCDKSPQVFAQYIARNRYAQCAQWVVRLVCAWRTNALVRAAKW